MASRPHRRSDHQLFWRQELKFGDLLIRSSETTHPLTPPCDVQPGDTAVLATDDGWGDAIPLIIRRDDRT